MKELDEVFSILTCEFVTCVKIDNSVTQCNGANI